jgi:ubiquinone/menaquinone biosynthesis C-methylase UbiE
MHVDIGTRAGQEIAYHTGEYHDQEFGARGDTHNSILTVGLHLSDEIAMTSDHTGATLVYRFADTRGIVRASDDVRRLLACFPVRNSVSVKEALELFRNGWPCGAGPFDKERCLDVIRELVRLRVLLPESEDNSSLYDARMAEFYVLHRAVPEAVCEKIIREAPIRRDSTILDVATGTGTLALQLAKTSDYVNAIDISQPFLNKARSLASLEHVNVTFQLADANKLVFSPERYDVVTISQAFHWLDRLSAIRGISHVLRDNGIAFFIETSAVLPSSHPLKLLFQYGHADCDDIQSFFDVQASSYSRWFELLQGRSTTLHLTDRWIIPEERQFDIGFARAFFFESQVKSVVGSNGDPWSRLDDVFKSSGGTTFNGRMYWHIIKCSKHPLAATVPIPPFTDGQTGTANSVDTPTCPTVCVSPSDSA